MRVVKRGNSGCVRSMVGSKVLKALNMNRGRKNPSQCGSNACIPLDLTRNSTSLSEKSTRNRADILVPME